MGCCDSLGVSLLSVALTVPVIVMSGIGLSRYGAPCSERVELYLASEFIVSVMGVVCVNIASILCVRQADSIHHGVEKMKKSHFRLIQVVLGLVEFCNMIFGSVFVFSTSTAKCDPLLWKMALGCLILQYLSFFLMFCCLGCVCCCASILIALGIANSPPVPPDTATPTAESTAAATPTDEEAQPLLHKDISM